MSGIQSSTFVTPFLFEIFHIYHFSVKASLYAFVKSNIKLGPEVKRRVENLVFMLYST